MTRKKTEAYCRIRNITGQLGLTKKELKGAVQLGLERHFDPVLFIERMEEPETFEL
jgi:hypothetical protein